jgi:hypothetical protein
MQKKHCSIDGSIDGGTSAFYQLPALQAVIVSSCLSRVLMANAANLGGTGLSGS